MVDGFMAPGGQQVGGRAPGAPQLRSATTKRTAPSPQQSPLQGQDPLAVRRATGQISPDQAQQQSLQRLAQMGVLDPNDPRPEVQGSIPGQGGFQVASPAREQIDPNDRGTRLSFEGFNIPQLNPQQVQAGQQGRAPGLDFEGFGLDPSQFGAGGQFDASGGGVGRGFNVNPQSVMEQAMKTFQSQLPGMNLDFADQTEGLAKKTSALGRTGSGLFNRDTDELSDRARANRESLLGNLSFQGATTDAGNDLQAQIATGGFQQQGLNRLLQGRQSGAQNALQAVMTGADLNQRGQQFDIGNQINRDQFNIGNNMEADLANQGAGMEAGQFNINNALQGALEQMGLAERQQGREDNMAQQAQQNIFQQLGLLGQGFQGDPTQALQGLAGTQLAAGQEFGANAGQINQGMQGLGNFTGDMLGQFLANRGQGIPEAPAPIPEPQFDPTGTFLG